MAGRDPVKQQQAKRRYYEANRDAVKAKSKAVSKRTRTIVYAWLLEYLESHPCIDCGETNPVVLEFDHIGEKEFSIGNVARRSISLKRVISEVAKCEVRCANCHRQKTYREAGRTHRG